MNQRQYKRKKKRIEIYKRGALRQLDFSLGLLKGKSGLYFDTKHFNFKRLTAYGRDVVLDWEQRAAGRTTSAFYEILDNFEKTGGASCFARRSQAEADAVALSFLSELGKFKIFANIGKYFYIKQGAIGYVLYYHQKMKDKKGEEYDQSVEVCYFVSIKTASGKKSIQFPETNLFFIDECVPEDGKELKDEGTKVASLINTVLRDKTRRSRIYLFSNAGSINNPYFRIFKIKIPKKGFISKGTAISPDGDRVSWVFCYGSKNKDLIAKDKKGLGMRFSSLTDYRNVSASIDFLDDDANVVKLKGVQVEPMYNVYIDKNRAFTVNYIVENDLIYISDLNPKVTEKYAFNYKLTLSQRAEFVDRKSVVFKNIEANVINCKVLFKDQRLKNAIIDLLNGDIDK